MKISTSDAVQAQIAARAEAEARARAEAAAAQAKGAAAAKPTDAFAMSPANTFQAQYGTSGASDSATPAATTTTATGDLDISKPPAGYDITATEWSQMSKEDRTAIVQAAQPATSSDPVKAAQAQVQTDLAAITENSYVDQTKIPGLIAAHANDPVYVAQMMKALDASGGLVPTIATTYNEGTDAQKQQLTAALKVAEGQGTISRDEINKYIDGFKNSPVSTPADYLSKVAGLDPAAAAAQLVQTAQTPEMRAAALSALNAVCAKTQSNLSELNQELARELTRFGPTFKTPADRDAFIAAFKGKHPEFAAADSAQQALGNFTAKNLDALKADAKSNPDAAKALYEACATLAGGKNNGIVAEALKDPALANALQAAAKAEGKDFAKTATTVLGTMAAEGAIEAAGDPEEQKDLIASLNELVESLKQVPELAESAQSALETVDKLGMAFDTMAKAIAGGMTVKAAGKELLDTLGEIDKDLANEPGNPLGKALGGATFLLGAAMVGKGLVEGDPRELMKGFVQAGGSLDAVGDGMELAARVLPNIVSKEVAEGVSDVTGKIAGVIGALTSTVSFLGDLGNLGTDEGKVQAISDFLSAAGGIALCIPGGQIPGVILEALGMGAQLLTGWAHQQDVDDKNAAWDKEGLAIAQGLEGPPTSLDPKSVDLLGRLPLVTIQDASTKLHLTADDWKSMANQQTGVADLLKQYGAHFINQLADGFGLTSYNQLVEFYNEAGGSSDVGKRFFGDLAKMSGESTRDLRRDFETLMLGPSTTTGQAGMQEPVPNQAPPPADPYYELLNRFNGMLNARP